ncbi:Transglycosylase SLT domain-containing protein [Ensifer sp. YR511]|nr:Transglycosylase SLT domain-containing protein [Ensifer sp. YR511]
MRELTAEVGLRFAGAPGVRKAKLDTPTFTKLFTTLVHRESNFKPRAVSPAGARGLGQLMPLTARDLGVKDSFSPDENLVGAATYLTEMLDRFESPELALAAYNAGPAAVEKYRGIPPYRETRQYVADIFHEVLREPYPTYVTARMKQHALRLDPDIQLASLTAESRTAPANKDPFATLLTGTPQVTQDGARLELTAFTSTTEASTAPSAPSKVAQRSEVLPTPDPEPRPEMGRTSASETGGAAIRATPLPPDLTTLPEPREFTGELSKAQLAIRDLATDIALLHSKAPGVENSGLSEEAFATLFVALIRRESSFNSRAVSRDGAKGLGQLKPATIREMGVKNPFSAKENLEGSVKYFTGLLDEFSSPVLALAGYNAGRTAVREKGGIPDDRKTRQFIADVLHDIKSDPRPEFVVVRLNKWSAALVVSSEEAAKLNTVSELARQGLVKSEPKQSSRPHSAEQQIERPVFAAAINPVALSGGPTNGMTRGRFIASLSVAFVITGLCIAVAGTSAGDQSKTSGWKRLLRWSRCRSRSNKIDGACELGGAVPVVVQASSKEQACMSPAIASQIPKKTLHSRFV